MSLSAIFRFENLDSTKDLNDLYQYLFNKGVYWWDTTSQTNLIVASGASLNVTVAPFRALSYDGMHILSDSSITLALSSSKSYKIVCKAKYLYEDTPYIKVSAMTDVQIAADPESDYYIVLSDVSTAAAVPAIDFNNTDLISEIGYDPYKGYYDSADEIETNSLTRAGDFCFVSNPSGDPAVIMYVYSGSEWVSYGNTESIATDLTIHKANGDTGITPVTITFNDDGVVGEVYDPGCLHVSLNMLNAMRWFGDGETPASRTNRFVTQSSPYALTVSLQGACVGNRPNATNPSGVPSATNPFVVSNTPIAIETDIAVTTSASEPNYIALPCVAWNGSSTTASPGFFVGFGYAGTAQEYFDLLSTLDGVLTNSAGEVIAIEGVYTKSGSVYTELNPSTSASAYGYWWQNGASLYLKVGKAGTGLIDSSGTAKVKCYIRSSYGLGDIAGDMSSSNVRSPSVQRIYKCGLREFGAIHFDSAKSYNSAETTTVSINPTTIVFDDTATTNYVKSNTINSGSTSIEETYAIPAGGSEVYSSLLTKNILSLERSITSTEGDYSSHIYLNNPSLFECYYSDAPGHVSSIVNRMKYTFTTGVLSIYKLQNQVTSTTTINPGSIVVSNPASTYPGSTTISGVQITFSGNYSRVYSGSTLTIEANQSSGHLFLASNNTTLTGTTELHIESASEYLVGSAILSLSSPNLVLSATGSEGVSINGTGLSISTSYVSAICSGSIAMTANGGNANFTSVSTHATNITGGNVNITANASSGATITLTAPTVSIISSSATSITSPSISLSSSTSVTVSSDVDLHITSDTKIYLTAPTISITSTAVELSSADVSLVNSSLHITDSSVPTTYVSVSNSLLFMSSSSSSAYLASSSLHITNGTDSSAIGTNSIQVTDGTDSVTLTSSGNLTMTGTRNEKCVERTGTSQEITSIGVVGDRKCYYYINGSTVNYYINDTTQGTPITVSVGHSMEFICTGNGTLGWWSPMSL